MNDKQSDPIELSDLEPLGAHDELEPLGAHDELESHGDASAAPAAPLRAADDGSEKRELEQAPVMLRKAALILLVGALFPWLAAMHDSTIAWVPLMAGKGIALLAAWIYHQGTVAHYGGGKPAGFALKLAAMRKPVPERKRGEKKVEEGGVQAVQRLLGNHVIGIVTSVLALVAMVVVYELWPEGVGGSWGAGAGWGEVATVLLATCTISSIYGYEHGGAFKPILPLMFLGPGVAGLFGILKAVSNSPIGAVGDVIVAVGGLMAMYVMVIALKQAKVEGDQKKEEAREARKAARATGRGGRTAQ